MSRCHCMYSISNIINIRYNITEPQILYNMVSSNIRLVSQLCRDDLHRVLHWIYLSYKPGQVNNWIVRVESTAY